MSSFERQLVTWHACIVRWLQHVHQLVTWHAHVYQYTHSATVTRHPWAFGIWIIETIYRWVAGFSLRQRKYLTKSTEPATVAIHWPHSFLHPSISYKFNIILLQTLWVFTRTRTMDKVWYLVKMTQLLGWSKKTMLHTFFWSQEQDWQVILFFSTVWQKNKVFSISIHKAVVHWSALSWWFTWTCISVAISTWNHIIILLFAPASPSVSWNSAYSVSSMWQLYWFLWMIGALLLALLGWPWGGPGG